MKHSFLLFLTAFLCFGNISAQGDAIGGPHILTDSRFAWKQVSTENFDLHYYTDDPALAQTAAKYAEEGLWDIGRSLDYKNRSRYAIYIYLTAADFSRSNMAREQRFKEGGVTPLRNNTVAVVFPGSLREFQREIKSEIARLAIEDYYFGGSVQSAIQNTVLLYLPAWYIDGMTTYLGEGWTVEDEMWLSSLDRTEMLQLALEGDDPVSVRARKSIFQFIVSQYGRDKLSEIFYMTRLTRSAEDGIIHVLGITLKTLTERWREYVVTRLIEYKTFRNSSSEAGNAISLEKNQRILGYALAPDATKLAMVVEEEGKQMLLLRDMSSGLVTETAVSGGYLTDQYDRFEMNLPVVWSPNSEQVALVIYKDFHETLAFYNVKEDAATYKIPGKKLDHINSLAWSHDGKQLVASALNRGTIDLYLFNPGANGFKMLTEDLFENHHPVWSLDDQRIYFASNRLNDSIPNEEVKFNVYREHDDIWEIDVNSKELRRVTTLPLSNQIPVAAISSFELLIRTSENGIYNLEKINVFVGARGAHTNVSYGLHSVSLAGDDLIYAIPYDGGLQLYQTTLPELETEDARVRTSYQAVIFREWQRQQEEIRVKAVQDSLKAVEEALKLREPVVVEDSIKTEEPEEEAPKVKYYVFDEEEEQPQRSRRRYLRSRQLLKKKEPVRPDFDQIEIGRPERSTSKWTTDQVTTRFGFDPVFKLSLLMEVRLKDQLNNRSLVAGFMPYIDFKSGDTYIRYQNRAGTFNYEVGGLRRSRFLNRDQFSARFNATRVDGLVTRPLSRYMSVGVGGQAVYLNRFNINTLIPRDIDDRDVLAGARINLRYDKTEREEQFIYDGLFANVDLFNAYSAINSRNEFLTAQLDIRKYTSFRKVVLATRLSSAYSVGENPQNFFLGGIDDLLFSQFNNLADFPLQNGALSDFHFMEYLTPTRGFRFNARNGSKYLLANAELRLPIGRMFRSSLNSNPLYNFQLIPFFDFGTAWDQGNPLSQKNPIDTETINTYPLNITVQTLKSPFVMGFGAGFRMMLLGYQIRTDLAWGVEDYTVLRPRLHFSLGKNF